MRAAPQSFSRVFKNRDSGRRRAGVNCGAKTPWNPGRAGCVR